MKAELHVHLEGLECDNVTTYKNKDEFIKHLVDTTYKNRLDYYKILKNYLTKNKGIISYCEITVGVVLHMRMGRSIDSLFEDLNRAASECPFVTTRFIALISPPMYIQEQYSVIRTLNHKKHNIVALGIGGQFEFPFDYYKDFIADAKSLGLFVTAHAGESTDPTIVRSAIEHGVDRIDHGVGATYDDTVLELLKAKNIGLTVCPLSNKALGIPCNLRKLVDSGVKFCLNTDDPGFFNCDINDVYKYCKEEFNLTDKEIQKIEADSFQMS